MVTHEPDVAKYSKRIIVMRDGQVRGDDLVKDRLDAAEELKNLPVEAAP